MKSGLVGVVRTDVLFLEKDATHLGFWMKDATQPEFRMRCGDLQLFVVTIDRKPPPRRTPDANTSAIGELTFYKK